MSHAILNRRSFLHGGLALGAAAFTVPGLFADELIRTPTSTEGPFYPDRLPLDTDNDLIIVNSNVTPAVGQITHLTGRVLTRAGSPVRDVTVEIWQVDNRGSYLHSRGEGDNGRDSNFQGFGRCRTDSRGRYYFRTIKPVPYTVGGFRTPHIHIMVKRSERPIFTSQIFVNGAPENARDGIFTSLGRNPITRELLVADFRPVPNSRLRELEANFDIVLGVTPQDA